MKQPLKLRMKVWTNPDNGLLYLVPRGHYDADKDLMMVHAMRDEYTMQICLSPEEWNALGYKFFLEDVDAPRPAKKTFIDRDGRGVVTL